MMNGANAVGSLNMRSPVALKMAVPPGDTTLAYKFLRMSTLHIMCSGNKYSGFRRLRARLEQHFCVTEAFDAKKKFRLVEQPPDLCMFFVLKETFHQHARAALSHNLQEKGQDIVLTFLVRRDRFFGDELGKRSATCDMWNASEMTQERGDNNTLRQSRMAAHLLGCSLREGLDNIRRSWKRSKRRLGEAVSCHMDVMYLSREWSRCIEVASILYCDRTASSSTSDLVDDICHPGIRDRPGRALTWRRSCRCPQKTMVRRPQSNTSQTPLTSQFARC